MSDQSLSSAIKHLRCSLGETQRNFSQRIGVSVTTAIKYESGAQSPKPAVLKTLSEIAKEQNLEDLSEFFNRSHLEKVEKMRLLRLEQHRRSADELRQTWLLNVNRSKAQGNQQWFAVGNGKTYTPLVLWKCVQQQINASKRSKLDHQFFLLTVTLMGYAVFEAYVNYISEVFAPDLQAAEGDKSSQAPCKGTTGKLREILKLNGIEYPDPNKRPFKSVLAIRNLRNQIIRSKMGSKRFGDEFYTRLLHRLLKDLEQFLEGLHSQLRQHDKQGLLTPYALKTSASISRSESVLTDAE